MPILYVFRMCLWSFLKSLSFYPFLRDFQNLVWVKLGVIITLILLFSYDESLKNRVWLILLLAWVDKINHTLSIGLTLIISFRFELLILIGIILYISRGLLILGISRFVRINYSYFVMDYGNLHHSSCLSIWWLSLIMRNYAWKLIYLKMN